jgi:hypothetical protein
MVEHETQRLDFETLMDDIWNNNDNYSYTNCSTNWDKTGGYSVVVHYVEKVEEEEKEEKNEESERETKLRNKPHKVTIVKPKIIEESDNEQA